MSYFLPLSTLLDDDTDKDTDTEDDEEENDPVTSPDANLITLLVGPDARRLQISESSIRKVTFFRKALDSGMKEAQERTIHLEAESYKVVKGLVRWLERGAPMAASDLERVDFRIDLWLLGEWLLCPELQNAVMHSITIQGPPMHESHYQPEAIAEVYQRTMEDSKIRRVLVDLFLVPRILKKKRRKWMPIISADCDAQVHDDVQDRVDDFEMALESMRFWQRRRDVGWAVRRVLVDTNYMVPVLVDGVWVTPDQPVIERPTGSIGSWTFNTSPYNDEGAPGFVDFPSSILRVV